MLKTRKKVNLLHDDRHTDAKRNTYPSPQLILLKHFTNTI